MSQNTAKPALTRKRAKRVVEYTEYVSFTGRILRAYARRIAAGDIEALRSLTQVRSGSFTDTPMPREQRQVTLREYAERWRLSREIGWAVETRKAG